MDPERRIAILEAAFLDLLDQSRAREADLMQRIARLEAEAERRRFGEAMRDLVLRPDPRQFELRLAGRAGRRGTA